MWKGYFHVMKLFYVPESYPSLKCELLKCFWCSGGSGKNWFSKLTKNFSLKHSLMSCSI